METMLYLKSLCLGLLVISYQCLGIALSIDNRTHVPFAVTVLKNGNVEDILIPTETITKIGTLEHRAFKNVRNITHIKFNESWQSWGKRLAKWEYLPEFTAQDAVKLDKVLAQLKEKAKKTSSQNDLIIEIGLDNEKNWTFHGRVVGEWVDVHQ